MTEQEARLKICAGLSKIYGPQEGFRMAGTVVNGIVKDFAQMVRESGSTGVVREEYRLEDGRAVVSLSGRMEQGGAARYESVLVRFGAK